MGTTLSKKDLLKKLRLNKKSSKFKNPNFLILSGWISVKKVRYWLYDSDYEKMVEKFKKKLKLKKGCLGVSGETVVYWL